VHDPYAPPDDKIALFLPDYHGRILDGVRQVRTNPTGWWQVHDAFWKTVDRSSPADAEVLRRLYDAGIRNMDETTLPPLLRLPPPATGPRRRSHPPPRGGRRAGPAIYCTGPPPPARSPCRSPSVFPAGSPRIVASRRASA